MESGDLGDDLTPVTSTCCSAETTILRSKRHGSYSSMNARKWEVGRERCYYAIMYL